MLFVHQSQFYAKLRFHFHHTNTFMKKRNLQKPVMKRQSNQAAVAPQAEGARRPRILWASLYSLLDTSSGAAISVREMLRQLSFNGYEVAVVGATLFDSEQGLSRVPQNWMSSLEKGVVVRYADQPLLHNLLVTGSTSRREMTLHEADQWLTLYQQMLDRFKPDLLLFYGGRSIELLIADEARQRAIPVAMYLANGSYTGRRWCRDVDLLVTNSRATTDYYRPAIDKKFAMPGRFVDPRTVRAEQQSRTNLLFVNPSMAKGAAIVISLALELEKLRPDITIEVVESRGCWKSLLKVITSQLGEEREHLANVLLTPNTPDMRPVYGRARLLIAPSLWWESSGRVAVEAMINGIPAMVTNRGGLPEMVGSGGIKMSFPDIYYEKPWNKLPSTELLAPLIATIIRFYDDEAWYQMFVARAFQAAETLHHIGTSTERLMLAFEPFIAKRAGDRMV